MSATVSLVTLIKVCSPLQGLPDRLEISVLMKQIGLPCINVIPRSTNDGALALRWSDLFYSWVLHGPQPGPYMDLNLGPA